LFEGLNLLLENAQVGRIDAVIGDAVVVKLDLAQAFGGTLVKQEAVVAALIAFGDLRVGRREEDVVGVVSCCRSISPLFHANRFD